MKETFLFMSVEADSGVTEADTVTVEADFGAAEADSVSTDAASVRGKAGGDRPRVRPWGRVRVYLSCGCVSRAPAFPVRPRRKDIGRCKSLILTL